jgi:hypothetical protein
MYDDQRGTKAQQSEDRHKRPLYSKELPIITNIAAAKAPTPPSTPVTENVDLAQPLVAALTIK